MLYYKLKNYIFNGEKMKYSLFFDKIKSVYELAGIIENEPMCKHTTFCKCFTIVLATFCHYLTVLFTIYRYSVNSACTLNFRTANAGLTDRM